MHENSPSDPGVLKPEAKATSRQEPATRRRSESADLPDGKNKLPGNEALSLTLKTAAAVPVEAGGTWEQVIALGRYMTRTEVHTYAFSVAAQVILSLFPFIVLLLTISRSVFHSTKMVDLVSPDVDELSAQQSGVRDA